MLPSVTFHLIEVEVEGTMLSRDEIRRLAADFVGRAISLSDLLLLQERLSNYLVERGYLLSRVRLNRQKTDISGGVAVFEEVSRNVSLRIEAQGLRDSYIRHQIGQFLNTPLSQEDITNILYNLQGDPLIDSFTVNIAGEDPAILTIAVRAARPWRLEVEASNDENPDIGEGGVRFFFGNGNVAGGGENLFGEYKLTDGLERWQVGAIIPMTPKHGRLQVVYQQSDGRLVSGFLDLFDVSNRSYVLSAGFVQPILFLPRHKFELGLSGDRKESQSFVLGDRQFADVEASSIRFSQSYSYGSSSDGLIALSQFSFGTTNIEGARNYFHWNGQVQWERDLRWMKLYVRGAAQLAADVLPGFERCAIGGRNGNQFIFGNSIRGVTTNGNSGDNCVAFTGELRFPLLRGEEVNLQVFPFFDFGYVWDGEGRTLNPQAIPSLGAGFRFDWRGLISVQGNYGYAFGDFDSNLQDGLRRQELSGSILFNWKF
jgi:hemolysin activation/secretion protein